MAAICLQHPIKATAEGPVSLEVIVMMPQPMFKRLGSVFEQLYSVNGGEIKRMLSRSWLVYRRDAALDIDLDASEGESKKK